MFALTNLNIRNADFSSVTINTSFIDGITSGITVMIKDAAAQTFINARLDAAVKTGTVTIAGGTDQVSSSSTNQTSS